MAARNSPDGHPSFFVICPIHPDLYVKVSIKTYAKALWFTLFVKKSFCYNKGKRRRFAPRRFLSLALDFILI